MNAEGSKDNRSYRTSFDTNAAVVLLDITPVRLVIGFATITHPK